MATVAAVKEDPRDWRITFQVPAEIMQYIVPKGSVTVDGTSMTIAEVAPAPRNTFTLAVIPTTLHHTTLSGLRTGDKVNVETDILARTVVHWLSLMNGSGTKAPNGESGITLAKLRELGMT
jgi:riboflavin synthase